MRIIQVNDKLEVIKEEEINMAECKKRRDYYSNYIRGSEDNVCTDYGFWVMMYERLNFYTQLILKNQRR